MRDFFKKLLAASEDRKISLNDRLSARMILVSVPAGFFGMIVCLFAHTHIVAVAITAFLWISIPICYAFLILKGKIKTLELIMLIALLILIPPL